MAICARHVPTRVFNGHSVLHVSSNAPLRPSDRCISTSMSRFMGNFLQSSRYARCLGGFNLDSCCHTRGSGGNSTRCIRRVRAVMSVKGVLPCSKCGLGPTCSASRVRAVTQSCLCVGRLHGVAGRTGSRNASSVSLLVRCLMGYNCRPLRRIATTCVERIVRGTLGRLRPPPHRTGAGGGGNGG